MSEGLRCVELTPDLWPALERLFGPQGACGGCWCMWWRVPRAGKLWQETKGAPAKRRFKRLVLAGEALGVLAFAGDEAVGWCAFGPRRAFPKLERARAYQRADTEGVWSVNCFYVARAWRGRGVTRALLDAAVEACARQGAAAVEAYPVTTTRDGRRVAATFAYTGPIGIFEERGFEVVQRESPTRPLVRLRLDGSRSG